MELFPGLNAYSVPGVAVFIANKTVHFCAGQHAHEEYEFFMPLNDEIIGQCDNIPGTIEKRKFIPYNSGQKHGAYKEALVNKLICVTCSKEYMMNIAQESFHTSELVFENVCFQPSNSIRLIIGQFTEEEIAKRPGYRDVQTCLARMLVTELIRCSKNNINANGSVRVEDVFKEKAGIRSAMDFLCQQFFLEFSLEEAASVAGMSPYHFIREFKKYTGQTPHKFYIGIKVKNAKELLHDKEKSITEIALETGFSNAGNFSTVFKQYTGMTPSQYRDMIC